MKITEIQLNKADGTDNELAFGSITFDGGFVIAGIRVIKGNDGEPLVAYPSRKNAKGEHKDICFPMTRALREDIQMQILAKYEEL